MSHFTCLVIGEDYEEQLAPFHEYEATDRDDEYVIDVDVTEELRKEYETKTEKVFVRDNEIVDAYDDRFYRLPTEDEMEKLGDLWGSFGTSNGLLYSSKDWGDGRGFAPRIHERPKGWSEEERPVRNEKSLFRYLKEAVAKDRSLKLEVDGMPFATWLGVRDSPKFETLTVLHHTNPNGKWDGYCIGGRWQGFFPLKAGRLPGKDRAVQVRLKDIDFERAIKEATEDAVRVFDKWNTFVLKYGRPRSWEEIRDQYGDKRLTEARDVYWSQRSIKEYIERDACDSRHPVTDIGFSKKDYIAKRCSSVLIPFAVVKDKTWHARGRMGWFAAVHDERDQNEWNDEVWGLYRDLPEDTLLTLVDCHS